MRESVRRLVDLHLHSSKRTLVTFRGTWKEALQGVPPETVSQHKAANEEGKVEVLRALFATAMADDKKNLHKETYVQETSAIRGLQMLETLKHVLATLRDTWEGNFSRRGRHHDRRGNGRVPHLP